MDISIPKQLQMSLEYLTTENVLSSWTIQGNCNMTTVILRFKMEAAEHNQSEAVKYKRVNKSQMDRNSDRAQKWHNRQTSETIDPQGNTNPDDTIMDTDADTTDAPTDLITMPDLATPILSKPPSPRVTRSRTQLSVKAKSFTPIHPTPIPQVDGTTDHAHGNNVGVSQEDTIDTAGMKDWEKSFYKRVCSFSSCSDGGGGNG